MAKILIEDLHPIAKTNMDVAFPWAFCLCRVIRNRLYPYEEIEDKDPKQLNKALLAGVMGISALSPEERRLNALREKKNKRDLQAKADQHH